MSKLTQKITWGADPELFVTNEAGIPVPPVQLLPNVKVVTSFGEEGGVNRDGIAFELNPAPSTDPYSVSNRMHKLLQVGMQRMAEVGLKAIRNVEVTIGQGLEPDVYEFGCSPDFNAYTRSQNRVPVDPAKYMLRHAGGHITMGLPEGVNLKWEEVCELVKLFDYWAGLRSLQWSQSGSAERRKVYGAAGCFRWNEEKRIVEYRTPDAGWLWNQAYPTLCTRMEHAFCQFVAGVKLAKPKAVVNAINTCNWEMAQGLMTFV